MSTFVAESPTGWNQPKSLLDLGNFHGLIVNGLVVGCLTILLTASDAFETGQLGVAHQTTLWAIISLLLVTQLSSAKYILSQSLPENRFHTAITVVLSLAVTILLMTIELHWLKSTPLLPKQPDPFLDFLVFLTPPMGAIAGLILFAQHLAQQNRKLQAIENAKHDQELDSGIRDERNTESRQQNTASEIAGPMNMVRAAQSYSIKHVQVEDHYLVINCLEGKLLIRSRMKDALACLQAADGIQVHRSHWVAKNYIKRLYREGRDFKLQLLDGSVVPVARSRVEALRSKL